MIDRFIKDFLYLEDIQAEDHASANPRIRQDPSSRRTRGFSGAHSTLSLGDMLIFASAASRC